MIWQLVEVYPSVAVWKCQEQDDGQWRTWWQATDHASGSVAVPSDDPMDRTTTREGALSLERMTNARATYRAVCAHQDACKRELDAALKNLQACQRALSKEVW